MSPPRLLVIDDEVDICETIAEIAADRGFEVRAISNPESVSGLLETFQPDGVMLDLMMPGVDGVELLRLLSVRAKNAKVALMSGSDARVLNSARRLGTAHGLDVIAAFEKPLDISVLRNALDQMAGAPVLAEPAGADALGRAVADEQIILHYHPVVELRSRALVGLEALARWQHPQLGVLPPSEFIEQMKDEGLLPKLTEQVIALAIAQASNWQREGLNVPVAVNITASSLLDLTLPDRIADQCSRMGIPPGGLVLEVTESEAMRDTARILDVLLRLRLRGIGLAIDDFGTGFSSLRELQRMPFSLMKIDRSFVTDMIGNKDCATIVRTIVALGHSLGLKLVAEGVEDQRVWHSLLEIGCDMAQGFMVAKPMPAADVAGWLRVWQAGV